MSLIQDALEKTTGQQPKFSSKPKPETPLHIKAESKGGNGLKGISIPFKTAARPASVNSYYLAAGIGAVLVLGVVVWIFAQKNSGSDFDVTKAITAIPMMQAAETFIPPAADGGYTAEPFTLSGITTVEGERMALINNDIVRAGDVLNGEIIVSEILTKTVVLRSRGKEIRLNL